MAKATENDPFLDDEGWETVETGIGEQWDFDNGPMVGFVIGVEEVALPERSWGTNPDGSERKTAKAWKFNLASDGSEVFLWESYQLTEKLTEAGPGDAVRIFYEGERPIDNGRRRVKQYKVQIKKK